MSRSLLRPMVGSLALVASLSPLAFALRGGATRPAVVVEQLEGHETTATTITTTDLPTEHQELVAWAVELFDEAALALPPLDIVYHGDDRDRCWDRVGSHRSADGRSVIDICTSDTSLPTKVMILHEVSHAWIAHALDPESKEAFRQLRGWTHWRDHGSVAWHENGSEQAAEIMVWGLIDQPLRIVRIDQNDCDRLDAGYRTLTGAAPLHGFRDLC